MGATCKLQYSFKFKYKVGMSREGLQNLETKVNSAQANFSTSQSIHSRQTGKHKLGDLAQNDTGTVQLLNLTPLEVRHRNERDSHDQSRLFTFMDEKQIEKRVIQKYILRNQARSNNCEGQMRLKENKRASIIKLMEGQKKNREAFLNQIGNQTNQLKQNHSRNKLNNICKSKTPKHLSLLQNKQSTQERNRSKTPKFDQVKISTPRNQLEMNLFRAKSNLDKQQVQYLKDTGVKYLKGQQQHTFRIKKQQQQLKSAGEKQLLKKKRQLQKQLLAINQSLLQCKRTVKGAKKPVKLGAKTNRQKSKAKLMCY